MRASVCVLWPLTTRLRKAEVSIPGDCVIRPRLINLHPKDPTKLNCKVDIASGYLHIDPSEICGGTVFLDERTRSKKWREHPAPADDRTLHSNP